MLVPKYVSSRKANILTVLISYIILVMTSTLASFSIKNYWKKIKIMAHVAHLWGVGGSKFQLEASYLYHKLPD
jgi:uncharacterized membrane protein (UPF0182 family)